MTKLNTSGSLHGIQSLHRAHGIYAGRRIRFAALLGLSLAASSTVLAQTGGGISNGQFPGLGPSAAKPSIPTKPAITANGTVVEDIVARVNDQIITRTEYERSLEQIRQQGQQENWPANVLADRERNMLRDMIDQQLLLSKGKELGISGDTETMRQLDDMRKKANLESMEALEKAAEQQGISFEDFKQNIRNQVISQQVVSQEVGRRVDMSHSKEEAYYRDHAKEFEQPEQVHLSEILIPTPDNATDAQVSEAQVKADAAEAKLKAGTPFADVAKTSSGGPTASAGGDLGDFKRGMLGDVLEKATFDLPVGGITAPIRTRQGFVILKIDSHQKAGTPPLDQVEPQVQQALYLDELQPALRTYLTKAREDAYMSPLPAGFVDTGAPKESTSEVYTAYAPPKIKKKTLKKQEAETAAAAKAQAQLAEARQKLAAKQAADQAAKSGVKNVSAPGKPKKVKREKVRFGQAPRNALPAAPTEVAAAAAPGSPTEPGVATSVGIAPGAAMTNQQPGTIVTTGVGTENDDPLAPKVAEQEQKTRFSSRQHQTNEKKAEVKLASASVKADKRATPATAEEAADEKARAQPLGLKGDTVKKQPKHRRKKGEKLDRLQNQPVKPAEPPPIAPTVNQSLGAGVYNGAPKPADKPKADQSALPPTSTDTAAPNAGPEGQPIPAVTGTNPGAPASTVPQPH